MTASELTQKIKYGLKKSEVIFYYYCLMLSADMTHVNNAIIDRFGREQLPKIKKAAEKLL